MATKADPDPTAGAPASLRTTLSGLLSSPRSQPLSPVSSPLLTLRGGTEEEEEEEEEEEYRYVLTANPCLLSLSPHSFCSSIWTPSGLVGFGTTARFYSHKS